MWHACVWRRVCGGGREQRGYNNRFCLLVFCMLLLAGVAGDCVGEERGCIYKAAMSSRMSSRMLQKSSLLRCRICCVRAADVGTEDALSTLSTLSSVSVRLLFSVGNVSADADATLCRNDERKDGGSSSSTGTGDAGAGVDARVCECVGSAWRLCSVVWARAYFSVCCCCACVCSMRGCVFCFTALLCVSVPICTGGCAA